MSSKAIRILDTKNEIVSVKLSDILSVIPEGNDLFWSFLLLDSVPKKEYSNEVSKLENEISNSQQGLKISWNELIKLAPKIFQEIDLILIGCKNIEDLHRYPVEDEMYEKCDIVIQMIDSSYWEVYALQSDLLKPFAIKFKKTMLFSKD